MTVMFTATKCVDCACNAAHGMPHIMIGPEDADACVLPELNYLWTQGVETVCSCCGHGDPEAAYIVVRPEDRQRMIDLGYEALPPKSEGCADCGAFFRARLSDDYTCQVFREYPAEKGVTGTMFDVTPITSDKHMACGPVCLRMLLKYYGQDVPLDQLIEECHAGIAGCSGKDINVAGRLHGLDMRAFGMDAAELLRQDRPAIIHWRKNHFVVFCGIDDAGEPVICNPSRGRFALDAESFKVFYSGVAFFNGEPEDLPDPEPVPTPDDYGTRITALEDELSATKVILGVE